MAPGSTQIKRAVKGKVDLLSVGDIAKRLAVSTPQVIYVVDTRLQLRPVGRVGNARVFSGMILPQIEAELERIAERRIPARIEDSADEAVKVGAE